jgi:hypothetical protein
MNQQNCIVCIIGLTILMGILIYKIHIIRSNELFNTVTTQTSTNCVRNSEIDNSSVFYGHHPSVSTIPHVNKFNENNYSLVQSQNNTDYHGKHFPYPIETTASTLASTLASTEVSTA